MIPFISNVMPRSRYLQILPNIHVNDNNTMPQGNKDKLYKLGLLINSFNDNFIKSSE